MPNSLSIREQNSFISAYKNLLNENDKRIHKSDVNTLQKILNKCDKVEVGRLLMNKMESCPKDPTALENTFRKLFNKLETQKSGMHEVKEDKLKNIQQKLVPVVQDINNAKISSLIREHNIHVNFLSNGISDEKKAIAKLEKIITDTDVQTKILQNEIELLATELNSTSQLDFAAKDAQRAKDIEIKISKLESLQHAEISTLINKITLHENSRAKLLEFAVKQGFSGAEQDLKKAESGAIFDDRDKGFGTTSWREHLGSDKYAIKHFGYVLKEGRREYSTPTKVPNQEGRQWQKLMQNFNDAPKNIQALKRELTQLKNEYKSEVSQVESESRPSEKQQILQRINDKQKIIRSFNESKDDALGKIELHQEWVSSQEVERASRMAKIETLKSQLK